MSSLKRSRTNIALDDALCDNHCAALHVSPKAQQIGSYYSARFSNPMRSREKWASLPAEQKNFRLGRELAWIHRTSESNAVRLQSDERTPISRYT